MALHVLGSGDAQASVREFAHQFRRGKPLNKEIDSHHWVDGLNELQIRERDHLSNEELVAQLVAIGPEGSQGPVEHPAPGPVPAPPIRPAHRLGAAQVPARRRIYPRRLGPSHRHPRRHRPPMQLSAEHDGRLVADIVAEWASVHGQPFELVLDGTAGGKYSQGVDGERVEIDALDFIRTLAGRLPGTGVLSNPLPL